MEENKDSRENEIAAGNCKHHDSNEYENFCDNEDVKDVFLKNNSTGRSRNVFSVPAKLCKGCRKLFNGYFRYPDTKPKRPQDYE